MFSRSSAFVAKWLSELHPPAAAVAVAAAAPAAAAPAAKEEKKAVASSSTPAAAPAKAEKKAAAPAAAAAPAGEVSSMSKVAFIVGRVTEVAKHPESAKLYVEKIDLGEPTGPRTILSGLQEHITEEAFLNKLVLVVANLEPRKIGGIPSAGMVLCASSEGKAKTELLVIPEGTPIGERIVFPGHDHPAEPVLKKKLAKHWEEVAGSLTTDANGVANWNGLPFNTSKGPITSSIVNATVA